MHTLPSGRLARPTLFLRYARHLAGRLLLAWLALLLSPLWAWAAAQAPQGRPEGASPLEAEPGGRLVAPDIARILNRGELVVAIKFDDTPPFVVERGGVLGGVDIDLVRQIAASLKVGVRFDRSARTFDDVVMRVATGHADLGVSKLAQTPVRAQSVLFSTPYMLLDHGLLLNRVAFAKLSDGRSPTQTVRNFTGTIGVIAGSAWEEFGRRNFVHAQIRTYPSWKAVLDATVKGEVAGAYRDVLAIREFMQEDSRRALNLRTVTFKDLQSRLSVVVGVQNPVLHAYVNNFIEQMPDRPTLARLLNYGRQD